jgi:hypothetical protein
MANHQVIWNTATIEAAAENPPRPFPIGTQAGCSIRIDNNTQYGVRVLNNNTPFEYLKPNSYAILPMSRDYTVELDTSTTTNNVPANPSVSYTILSGVQTYAHGSTTFTGDLQVNITNSTINAVVTGEVTANISNSNLNVTIQNSVLEVTGSVAATITNSEINAKITNATLNVSGTVAIDTENNTVNIGNTPSVTISGTPSVNVESGSVNIVNTPTVNIGNTSINVQTAPGSSVTVAGTVEITNTPSVSISGTPTVAIANNQSINISSLPAIQIAANQSVSISGTPTVTVQSGSVSITGTPTVNIAGTPSVNIANTPTVNIGNTTINVQTAPGDSVTVAGTVEIANTPSVTISGTPTVAIANNQSINIGSLPAIQIAANQSVSISGTPTVTIAGTPTVNANITNANINATITNSTVNTNIGNAFIATNEMIALPVTTVTSNASGQLSPVTINIPTMGNSTYPIFNRVIINLTGTMPSSPPSVDNAWPMVSMFWNNDMLTTAQLETGYSLSNGYHWKGRFTSSDMGNKLYLNFGQLTLKANTQYTITAFIGLVQEPHPIEARVSDVNEPGVVSVGTTPVVVFDPTVYFNDVEPLYLIIQNIGSTPMWLNLGGVNLPAGNGLFLPPGAAWEAPPHFAPSSKIYGVTSSGTTSVYVAFATLF